MPYKYYRRRKKPQETGFPFNLLENLIQAGLIALEKRVSKAVEVHGEKAVQKARRFLLKFKRL
jgi:hypothetical protein